ncbi:membrane protein [Paractinoplanes abujensis]|uniref:DUF4231 domain-containing protein n=1 Tax=Paractinoplanes abujensis TaxID=882441 RepID=A0A7W7CZF2_9ACTN|nr:DUF4231 domain-containing protein [Actinoplanes abujensis]MBB4696335.1 hypothetical protein [Actinoplanes abujensis]GID22327.1 membrane protein [Actinoplanes abujensis]
MAAPSTVESDLPGLFRHADRAAIERQGRYLTVSRLGLIAAVAASVGSALSLDVTPALDLGGAISGLAFLAGGGLTLYLFRQRPDRAWYESRAVAESIKTLAWQFCMRGGSLDRDTPGDERVFAREVAALAGTMRHAGLIVTGPDANVTDTMRAVRALPLADRQAIYRAQRIDDQRRYYTHKGDENRRRARRWFLCAVAFHAIGVVLAWLKATNVVDADLLGIASTAAAGALAWVQTRDSQNLAEAYRVAAQELELIADLTPPDDPAAWSLYVGDGERAISREHTLWLARRS